MKTTARNAAIATAAALTIGWGINKIRQRRRRLLTPEQYREYIALRDANIDTDKVGGGML